MTRTPSSRRILAAATGLTGLVLLLSGTSASATVNTNSGLSAAAKGAARCPAGWFCFFDDLNYGGKMLKFRDKGRQDFKDWGFRDRTSSWVNNSKCTVEVYDQRSRMKDQHLWTMGGKSKNAWLGSSKNDRADYFVCR